MMSTFGMILLIMDLAALVESYSIDYFDCRTPKGISRYDVSQACKEERMNETDILLITKKRNQENERL